MSAIQRLRMTEEEYLRLERAAETKSEFYRGEVYAMAGASRFHNAVKDNFITQLNLRLNPQGCRTYSSDMKVWSPRTRLYSYPDIVIVCGKLEFKDEHTDILLNPKVVIEVLSPSTEKRDRVFKFKGYIAIDSVQEYLLVSQDEPFIERIVRSDGHWKMTPFEGLDIDFELSSLSVRIPMNAIYRDVEFEPVGE